MAQRGVIKKYPYIKKPLTVDVSWLGIMTNIVVIVSVIVSPAVYFVKKRLDRNASRNNAGCSILEEIDDIQHYLSDDGKIEPVRHVYDNDKKIKFYPAYVSYVGFQSAIHSVHYALFSKDLQKTLNYLYLKMELNNKMVDKNQDLFIFSKQNDIKLGTAGYHKLVINVWIQLTDIQNEMLADIQALPKGS